MTNLTADRRQDLRETSVARATVSSAPRRPVNTVALSLAVVLFILIADIVWRGAFAGGPNGNSFGDDFATSMGAARLVQRGGNPYDTGQLLASERAFLRAAGLPASAVPSDAPYTLMVHRVGNPPLFFWALGPLTRIGWTAAAPLWLSLELIALVLGFLGTISFLGWRRRLVPCLLFLAMPQPLFAVYYGNANVLVFAGIGAALALCRRYPRAAGAFLALAWIKPQLGIPLVLLLLLFHLPRRLATLGGFATATAGGVALTLLATGPGSVADWLGSMLTYPTGMLKEYELATLPPFLADWAPRGLVPALECALLAAAAAVTAATWWRLRRGPPVAVLRLGSLWALWFLALPFAHWHDEVLLSLPVLALLGPDGQNLVPRLRLLFERRRTAGYSRLPFIAVYLAFSTVFVPFPFPVHLLFVPVLGIGACLALAARRDGTAAACTVQIPTGGPAEISPVPRSPG